MEEELKRLKKGIRQLKKHCETWIRCTNDDKLKDVYIKMNSELEKILEKE